MIKDEVIRISLQSAREWDSKQHPTRALSNYSMALMAMLSKSLIECESPEAGTGLLESVGAVECLQDLRGSFGRLRVEISAGKRPWSCIGGNYNLAAFSHIDGRIKDDAYEIEGSRQQAVRWDFRKAALLVEV